MKKFVKKISLFLMFCIFLTGVICIGIDPYNVFHYKAVRDNGVEPNKNYIKMAYVLHNPDKFDSFIFGSSRVGAIHGEKIDGQKCYNMTYSMGLPGEHLANLKTMVRKGIVPKAVYIGVDSISYTESVEKQQEEPLRASYEYLTENPLHFLETYMNARMALESLKVTRAYDSKDEMLQYFYEYGWIADYSTEQEQEYFENPIAYIGDGDYLDETLDDISEIVKLCRKNGIKLYIFTNPMYYITYNASLKQDYLVFLKKLAKITDFYNFSGLNDITTNQEYYIDTSHYNAYVGDMMLDCMCNGAKYDGLYEQGFGVYVTNDNIDDLIHLLNSVS